MLPIPQSATPSCISPQPSPAAPTVSVVPDAPRMRFSFADEGDSPPAPTTAHHTRTDLELVEDLLDRCWQEVGASELNPKMTDIVRLLEFKNKLRSSAEAEKTFWSLINRIRREELSEFGRVTVGDQTQETA